MKSTKLERVICAICLAILTFFMCSIGIRFFTRQILVKHLGMSNSFTSLILFDVQTLDDADAGSEASVDIDWQALYPFSDKALEEFSVKKVSRVEKFRNTVQSVEDKIDSYATDLLIGHNMINEAAYKYESLLQWNYVYYGEYNGVVKLSDGFLTSYIEKRDVTEAANSTIALADFCSDSDIDFLYIQAPHKNCKYEDPEISGTVDFSNQNADAFLSLLKAAGVNTYDLRETIHHEGLSHHELFYRTDHHWRAETGLWASQHVLRFLGEEYGYDVDPSVLDADLFSSVAYPEWFLGSQGKKVTLAATTPDDFSLLYPAYPTELHYEIPDAGIDVKGDFSVTYDMSKVDELDHYGTSPYTAYNYGDRPLIKVENKRLPENAKVLLLHDSFSDCMISFLAMGVKNIDALDIRHFNGSVEAYIESADPDVVIVLYEPSHIEEVNWTTGESLFDFR